MDAGAGAGGMELRKDSTRTRTHRASGLLEHLEAWHFVHTHHTQSTRTHTHSTRHSAHVTRHTAYSTQHAACSARSTHPPADSPSSSRSHTLHALLSATLIGYIAACNPTVFPIHGGYSGPTGSSTLTWIGWPGSGLASTRSPKCQQLFGPQGDCTRFVNFNFSLPYEDERLRVYWVYLQA